MSFVWNSPQAFGPALMSLGLESLDFVKFGTLILLASRFLPTKVSRVLLAAFVIYSVWYVFELYGLTRGDDVYGDRRIIFS